MNNSIHVRLICLLLVSTLTCTPPQSPSKIHAQASQTNNLTDPKELETFLDPIFTAQMSKLHIPGAVVSVVKDGKTIFTKGYGVADNERSNNAGQRA